MNLGTTPKRKIAFDDNSTSLSSMERAHQKQMDHRKQSIADIEGQVQRLQGLLLDLSQERDTLANENEQLKRSLPGKGVNVALYASDPAACKELPSVISLPSIIDVLRDMLPDMIGEALVMMETGQVAEPSCTDTKTHALARTQPVLQPVAYASTHARACSYARTQLRTRAQFRTYADRASARRGRCRAPTRTPSLALHR